jgi:hypothetical protein
VDEIQYLRRDFFDRGVFFVGLLFLTGGIKALPGCWFATADATSGWEISSLTKVEGALTTNEPRFLKT